MLSISEELNKFKLIDIAALEDAATISSNEKTAYELYNKAIENLREGSEDIAIIELKKAISLNSGFNEAVVLLGLSYYISGEYSLSAKVFRTITEIEKNGIMAQHYLDAIMQTEGNIAKDREVSAGINGRARKFLAKLFFKGAELFNERKKFKAMLRIAASTLIGIFIGFGINSAVDLPNRTNSAIADTFGNDAQYGVLEDAAVGMESGSGVIENGSIEIHPLISEAEKLYNSGKLEDAADKLVIARNVLLSEQDKQQYDRVSCEVFYKAGQKMFSDGYHLYVNGKYADSITKFNKAVSYNAPYNSLDNIYYLLGKAYRETGDYTNAVQAFNNVIALFPNSKYAEWAKLRVNELLIGQS